MKECGLPAAFFFYETATYENKNSNFIRKTGCLGDIGEYINNTKEINDE